MHVQIPSDEALDVSLFVVMFSTALEIEMKCCLMTLLVANSTVAALDHRAEWRMSIRPLPSPVVKLTLADSAALFLGLSRIAKQEFAVNSNSTQLAGYAYERPRERWF